jgi:hypothetical protein
MTKSNDWGKYESYEDYINRGLDNLFNTGKVGSTKPETKPIPKAATDTLVRSERPHRAKPKDAYDIVASYEHHEGDKQWLAGMLLRLPLAKREPVMLRYSQVYNSARSAGAEDKTELGQTRQEANTWLREFIDQP